MRHLFILLSVLFFFCDKNNPASPSISAQGTYITTSLQSGVTVSWEIVIYADNTYTMEIGSIVDGEYIIMASQEGTWTQNGNTLTLIAVTCMELDEEIDCEGPQTCTLTTDGLQYEDIKLSKQ